MIAQLAALLLAATAPPLVNYTVSIETRTWQPIELQDVDRIIESTALASLARRGDMRLVRTGFEELRAGDYSLLVSGRFIEEAEDFSVYLTFGPGKRADLPSFHVSATANIGKRPMAEMQSIMQALTTDTAKRLDALVAPHLRRVELPLLLDETREAPPPELWRWAPQAEPQLKNPTELLRRLTDPRNSDNERLGAIDPIAGAAFDQVPALAALERCVLRDPSADVRARCAEALEPAARVRVPTQRVLLQAIRQELDPRPLQALLEISRSFSALSRTEAIDTWLYLVASNDTPGDAMRVVVDVVQDEGDLPNLDVAVAACLRQQSLVPMKKSYCASRLLRSLPPARRDAVIMDYLRNAPTRELKDYNLVDDLLRAREGKLGGAACEVVATAAARSGSVRLAYAAADCVDPTALVVERLLAGAKGQDAGDFARFVAELAGDHPEHAPKVLEGLSALEAGLTRQACTPLPSRAVPVEEVRKAIERLKRRGR